MVLWIVGPENWSVLGEFLAYASPSYARSPVLQATDDAATPQILSGRTSLENH